jgi:hypothetical protein
MSGTRLRKSDVVVIETKRYLEDVLETTGDSMDKPEVRRRLIHLDARSSRGRADRIRIEVSTAGSAPSPRRWPRASIGGGSVALTADLGLPSSQMAAACIRIRIA